MKITLFYFFAVACFLTLTRCGNKESRGTQNSYSKKNFDSLINDVDTSFRNGLDFSKGLLINKSFVEIYEHSSNYFDDVVNFLTLKEFTYSDAGYCVYAMQNLNVDRYVELCYVYLKLYNKKEIPEYILESTITPNFLGKNIIVDNHKSAEVIGLLNHISQNKTVSASFKIIIQDILSGDYGVI